MSVFLTPIYTQTVGAGGVSSITFNNIPQGFTDLKLVVSARSDQASSAGGYAGIVRLNSVTSNVSGNQVYGDGTAIGANRWDAIYINIGASNYTANTFGTTEVYIPNYTRGTFKQVQVETYSENNGSGAPIGQASVSWGSTAPVTTLTVLPFVGNFVQYSTFTLYGVSNVYDTATPLAPTIGTPVDLGGVISVPFTANDTGTGQTADNYSVTTSPSTSTFYTGATPAIVTSPTLGQAYTTTVAANNTIGSNVSNSSSSITTNNNYASIATYNITSNTSNVVFTNIPQYYSHLQLRFLFRDSAAFTERSFFIEVNGNNPSSSNSLHYVLGNGSSVSSSGSINQGRYASPAIPASSATSNVFGTVIGDLLEYANTSKFKTFRFFGGFDANGSGSVWLSSYTYASVSPVTALNIYTNSQMLPGCSVALYGIG